mmetsp:Transcript_50164/g.92650  ORF Transcript_50164/g.92650 Transcript_50164/m.92650 type:complete len:543 (-) Transcript_50164:206-1834(-)
MLAGHQDGGQVWTGQLHPWSLTAPALLPGTYQVADQSGNLLPVLHAGTHSSMDMAISGCAHRGVQSLADAVMALVQKLQDVEVLSDAECRQRLVEVRQHLTSLVTHAVSEPMAGYLDVAVQKQAPKLPPAHAPPMIPAAPLPSPPSIPASAASAEVGDRQASPRGQHGHYPGRAAVAPFLETPWASPAMCPLQAVTMDTRRMDDLRDMLDHIEPLPTAANHATDLNFPAEPASPLSPNLPEADMLPELSRGIASRLATGSDDGRLRVSNAETGALEHEILHSRLIWSLAWNPSGNRLAVGGEDRKLRLVDVDAGGTFVEVDHPRAVRSVAWCPSGDRVATACGFDVRVVSATTGRVLLERSLPKFLWAVAWHPAGAKLAVASEDKRVRVIDAATGEVQMEVEHKAVVHTVAWNNSGQLLATGSGDGMMRIVDAVTGKSVTEVEHKGAVRVVAWSPCDDELLATGTGGSGDDRKARVVNIRTLDCMSTVTHEGFVRALAWDPTGQRLATGSDDGLVRVVHVRTNVIEKEEFHSGYVRAVAWSN